MEEGLLERSEIMLAFVTTTILGLFISLLGIINMTGNIYSLHWYHRQRVTEENRKPFGKFVGSGTLIIGVAVIIFGALLLLFESTQNEIYVFVGTAELIVGIIAGLIISFYAMIKYNKGIF